MNSMRYARYSIVAVLVASMMLVVPQVGYSQAGTLTVKVDKTSFATGETITISGTVPAVIEGVPVAIQVFNPRNTMYTIDQVNPNADGTYSTTIKVGGKLGIPGIYTVKATYSNQSVQTTFELTGAGPKNTIPVDFEKNHFDVLATLTNGSIDGIDVDKDFISITVRVSTTAEDGELTITIPRELLDMKTDDKYCGTDKNDDTFTILLDSGEEAEATEKDTTTTDRTLVIQVPGNTEEIEIVGSCIVPEFGILAPLVLAAAVGAIIVASRKNQILKLLPRY